MRLEGPVLLQERRLLLYVYRRPLGGGLQGLALSRVEGAGLSCHRPGAPLGRVEGGFLQRVTEKVGGGPPGPFAVADDFLQHAGGQARRAAEEGAEEALRGLGVVQRSMGVLYFDPHHLGQRPQAVPLGVWDEYAGQLERVERFILEQLGVTAQKVQVEPHAMADDGVLADEAGQPR